MDPEYTNFLAFYLSNATSFQPQKQQSKARSFRKIEKKGTKKSEFQEFASRITLQSYIDYLKQDYEQDKENWNSFSKRTRVKGLDHFIQQLQDKKLPLADNKSEFTPVQMLNETLPNQTVKSLLNANPCPFSFSNSPSHPVEDTQNEREIELDQIVPFTDQTNNYLNHGSNFQTSRQKNLKRRTRRTQSEQVTVRNTVQFQEESDAGRLKNVCIDLSEYTDIFSNLTVQQTITGNKEISSMIHLNGKAIDNSSINENSIYEAESNYQQEEGDLIAEVPALQRYIHSFSDL